MPRLLTEDMQVGKVGTFQFSATKIDRLGATEYTLVTIAVDESGSVDSFSDELHKCLTSIIESCKKSARSDNLLVRVVTFNSTSIKEVHGFIPLSITDTQKYPPLDPQSMTPLFDTAYSTIGATISYAKTLTSNDFLTNGIIFIITDGEDTSSNMTPTDVLEEINKSKRAEVIESLVVILIGINAQSCQHHLERFQKEAGIDKYLDAGDATPDKLAKLAEFVSQSISSQSQALGTGISLTI